MVCKANYYSCLRLWKAWGDPQALSYTPENQEKTWALPSSSSTVATLSLNIPRKREVSTICLCQHSLKSQFYNLPIVNEKYRLSFTWYTFAKEKKDASICIMCHRLECGITGLAPLILTPTMWGKYPDLNFVDEDEVQRCWVICPKLWRNSVSKSGLEERLHSLASPDLT